MNRKAFAIFLGIASLLTSSTFAADIGTPSLSPPALPGDIFKDVPDTTKQRLSLQFTLGKFSGAFEETHFDNT